MDDDEDDYVAYNDDEENTLGNYSSEVAAMKQKASKRDGSNPLTRSLALPGKGDKGSKSGGLNGIRESLQNLDLGAALRKSRDSSGNGGFNGFMSLGKKQTAQKNADGTNIFGIRQEDIKKVS